MAEITPVGVFSGTTQTVLVIDHLSEPQPIKQDRRTGQPQPKDVEKFQAVDRQLDRGKTRQSQAEIG